MAEKTRQRFTEHNLDSLSDFEDHELQATMQEFLEEEKKANTNIWNVATIAGIAMFFIGMVYLIQALGLQVGPDLSGVIEVLPIIGGVLVTFIGFGFLVGDRKRGKSKKQRNKKEFDDFDFEYDEESERAAEEEFGLHNDLDSRSSGKKRDKNTKRATDYYAYRHAKKLYKSRSDKKWAGVCGGLANYFGISSTVIRLLFVITFFAGSGTSLLVYLALAIALDKEPVEFMDDF
ncbi:PspC domain-containing protein [Halalkalibaculum sp. DA3122]|uniref:PspC domain-containing protein n=1 Tax=Halalkalibaculum sp. DA3122 TaxID=3373607 RepID=UPI003754A8AB